MDHFCSHSNGKSKINARIFHLDHSPNKPIGYNWWKTTFSFWLQWGPDLPLNARTPFWKVPIYLRHLSSVNNLCKQKYYTPPLFGTNDVTKSDPRWRPHGVKKYLKNVGQLQQSTSNVCGLYCAYYIVYQHTDKTMKDILKDLKWNQKRNDRF